MSSDIQIIKETELLQVYMYTTVDSESDKALALKVEFNVIITSKNYKHAKKAEVALRFFKEIVSSDKSMDTNLYYNVHILLIGDAGPNPDKQSLDYRLRTLQVLPSMAQAICVDIYTGKMYSIHIKHLSGAYAN